MPAVRGDVAGGPPTALARRYVRWVVGFSVGVGIGMAPFLGKVKVPGFSPLLELFPLQLQGVLIPLSAFLMGTIAVGVQVLAGEGLKRSTLTRSLLSGLAVILASLVVFVVLYNLFVVSVRVPNGYVAVIVTSERLPGCGCAPASSDPDCIESLSLDPAALETCWGGPALKMRKLALQLNYLLLTGGFGALVGLLLLREEDQEKKRRRPSGKARRPTSPPPGEAPHP
jgi:hypothetical protein